jgi:hypothetical protein
VIDAELVHAGGAAKLLLVLTFEALGRLPIPLRDESDVRETGKPCVHESGLQSGRLHATAPGPWFQRAGK